LIISCSIIITFEFHSEIVFQSIEFKKKLFNLEAQSERRWGELLLPWPSTHGLQADQPQGHGIKGGTGGESRTQTCRKWSLPYQRTLRNLIRKGNMLSSLKIFSVQVHGQADRAAGEG
jgi:hypothetical protein